MCYIFMIALILLLWITTQFLRITSVLRAQRVICLLLQCQVYCLTIPVSRARLFNLVATCQCSAMWRAHMLPLCHPEWLQLWAVLCAECTLTTLESWLGKCWSWFGKLVHGPAIWQIKDIATTPTEGAVWRWVPSDGVCSKGWCYSEKDYLY